MPPPPLFYVSPEWDKYGRPTRHELVWNALDGHHDEVANWAAALQQRRQLSAKWQTPEVMLQQAEQDADFLAACGLTFAVKPAAWKAIKDLVADTAEALPVEVTRLIIPEKFGFPALPKAKRPSYLLLHGLFDLPMRHSQHGYWDVNKNRYDMSSGKFHNAPEDRCKELWLDPGEFAGKHLFLLNGEWVASAEFVERVVAKKLTGLVFHPIKYVDKSQPTAPQLKKIMPEPPRPDFKAAAKGYSEKLGKEWSALWDWTTEAVANRGWKPGKPKLKPPVAMKKITDFETKHGIKLPRDYVDVLTQLAGGVTLDFGRVKPSDPLHEAWDEVQRRIRELMFGGPMELWSVETPLAEYAQFKQWVDEIADAEPDSAYQQHFRNKLPITIVSNGDYITLDLKTGVPTYISHDGDDFLQGKPLGKNFVDFITRWSWCCLPWIDFLPVTSFYNQDSRSLPLMSPALTSWHTWLRGLPLPPETE